MHTETRVSFIQTDDEKFLGELKQFNSMGAGTPAWMPGNALEWTVIHVQIAYRAITQGMIFDCDTCWEIISAAYVQNVTYILVRKI